MIDRYKIWLGFENEINIYKDESGEWVKFEDHATEMMDYGNEIYKTMIPDNRITEDELELFFKTYDIKENDTHKYIIKDLIKSKGWIK